MRKLIALVAVMMLTVGGLTLHQDTEAEAASSIFEIHVARTNPNEQAWLKISPHQLADSWDPYFLQAAVIISNASPWMHMTFSGCTNGYPCSVPRLINVSPSSPWIQINYDLAGTHLFNWGTGLHEQDLGINGNRPASDAQRKAIACDALMRQVGVADGCKLDGWPSNEGLAMLQFFHQHVH